MISTLHPKRLLKRIQKSRTSFETLTTWISEIIAEISNQTLSVLRMVPLVTRNIKDYLLLILAKFAAIALSLISPLIMRHLIDNVAIDRNLDALYYVQLFLIVVVTFSLLTIVSVSYLGTKLQLKFVFALKRNVQEKWQVMRLHQFKKWGVGEHVFRMNNDVNNVKNVLVNGFPSTVMMLIEFVLFSSLAIHLSAYLTLLFLVILPVLAIADLILAQKVRPFNEQIQIFSSKANNRIVEYISGIFTVKLFQRERYLSRRHISLLAVIARTKIAKWRKESVIYSVRWALSVGWSWIVILIGFRMVVRDEITLGTLIALKMYLAALEKPIDAFSGLMQSLSIGSVSSNRLSETLDAVEERNVRTGCVLGNGPIKVEIDRLQFGYRQDNLIFSNCTVTFEPSTITALTGSSGSGKSTLVSLLTSLRKPKSGSIYFNGMELRDISLKSIRERISVLPQDLHLFSGSIRDNIAFGRSEASFDEIVCVAESVGADGFIQALDRGYLTEVSDTDIPLSGGQKQRIAIARSLLKDGGLLIMDEAFGPLDRESKLKVWKALRDLAETTTIIVITHDAEILRKCDRVVVLDGGTISDRPVAK